MISGPQFSLRAKFEVDNLQVLEGDNLVTANTFYIRDEQKSVELYTATKQDKEEWLEFLFLAIKSLYTRKSSLRVGRDILRPLDSEIGKKQPHMQKVENVQKCTECSAQFSILKHKHNCRFCGAVSESYQLSFAHPVFYNSTAIMTHFLPLCRCSAASVLTVGIPSHGRMDARLVSADLVTTC